MDPDPDRVIFEVKGTGFLIDPDPKFSRAWEESVSGAENLRKTVVIDQTSMPASDARPNLVLKAFSRFRFGFSVRVCHTNTLQYRDIIFKVVSGFIWVH